MTKAEQTFKVGHRVAVPVLGFTDPVPVEAIDMAMGPSGCMRLSGAWWSIGYLNSPGAHVEPCPSPSTETKADPCGWAVPGVWCVRDGAFGGGAPLRLESPESRVSWKAWTTCGATRSAGIDMRRPCAPEEASTLEEEYQRAIGGKAEKVPAGPAMDHPAAADRLRAARGPASDRYPLTCKHCGSPSYQGIGLPECSNQECGVEPEPTVLPVIITKMRERMTKEGRKTETVDEGAHQATGFVDGRFYEATHPTKDGAIAAWREAVKARGGR